MALGALGVGRDKLAAAVLRAVGWVSLPDNENMNDKKSQNQFWRLNVRKGL